LNPFVQCIVKGFDEKKATYCLTNKKPRRSLIYGAFCLLRVAAKECKASIQITNYKLVSYIQGQFLAPVYRLFF
jgi:hypothetical protein